MPIRSKATFLDHALHPMMVPIPLGALPTALVFDVLYVFTGTPAWYLAAFVATLVGVVGIALAAIPGFVDYQSVVPREGHVRRTATRHMALGVSLLVLYLGILGVRWATLADPGVGIAGWVLGLSVLGVLGLFLQGYLGGSLVEHHHLATETEVRAEPGGGGGAPGGGTS